MTKSVLIVLFVSAAICQAQQSSLYRGKWKLVFADEFDGPALNTSNWDIEVNCWGGGNNEKQCYTARSQNVYIENGVLNLRAIRETYSGTQQGCTLALGGDSCTKTMPSTSGRIRTLKAPHGSWLYGRFETRARMPTGDFTWPAIWMLPTDNVYGSWAASGEIDIMEYRGQDRRKMLHTLHFGGGWPNNRYWGTTKDYPFDFTADFHNFVLEWEPNVMRFYVDETLSHTQSLDLSFGNIYKSNRSPFDQRFHMILNLAIGGNFFGGNYGPQDINRVAPGWTQPFQIDFVRIYRDASKDPVVVIECPAVNPNADIIVGQPSTAPLPPVELKASDDTFVWGGYFENHTFWQSSILFAKSSERAADNRVPYLKFGYTLPDTAIESATLAMFGATESPSEASLNVSVVAVDKTNWSGRTTTFASRPVIDDPSHIDSAQVTAELRNYYWNVTTSLQAASQAGLNTVSFALVTDKDAAAWFESSKVGMNPPKLIVTFKPKLRVENHYEWINPINA